MSVISPDSHARGAYYTDPDLAAAICECVIAEAPDLQEPGWTALDPSAGGGAFLADLAERAPYPALIALDIHPEAAAVATPGTPWVRRIGDFVGPLDETGLVPVGLAGLPRPQLVIGNPPYHIKKPLFDARGAPILHRKGKKIGQQKIQTIEVATAHVRRALLVSRRHVVFVLRLDFLGSKGRILTFWPSVPLRKVWVPGPRPSFLDGQTDTCEYGVFWFDHQWTGPAQIDWLLWARRPRPKKPRRIREKEPDEGGERP